MLAHQPAQAAAEREPADAGGRHDAAGGGQAVELRLSVVVAPGRAALGPDASRRRIDLHRAHLRQVDDEAAVAHGIAGDVVAAAADGDLEPVLTCGAHGRLRVGGATTLDDDRRTAVDEPVVDAPGGIVAGGVGQKDGAAHVRTQCGGSGL